MLLDNRFVADTWNLRRVQAVAEKHPGPVLRTPPRGGWSGLSYPSVAIDKDTGKFHLWYTVTHPGNHTLNEAARKAGKLAEFLEPCDGVRSRVGIAYATSDDGIHWTTPDVGTGPRLGTNVVHAGNSGVHAGCVVQGLFSGDPARKFTAYYTDWKGYGVGAHSYAHSPDGIHWTSDPANPFIHGESDSNNCVLKNPFGEGYLLYERVWDAAAWGWVKGNHRKRIAGLWSPDLYHWSEPWNILCPDELDDFEFYGISVFYRDGVLFGLVSERHVQRETMDIHLFFSRDGVRWDRLAVREKLFPRGAAGAFDAGLILPAYNPVEVNGDLRLYYAGRPSLHDNTGSDYEQKCGIGLATFPKSRLIGRRGDNEMGILLTHPFTITSDRLLIDAQTESNGWVVAELVEPDAVIPGGKPIAGFTRDDSDRFTGDDTGHALTWKGKQVAELKGRRVRLRMGLRMATVWSYDQPGG
jgi:hypothetical protein